MKKVLKWAHIPEVSNLPWKNSKGSSYTRSFKFTMKKSYKELTYPVLDRPGPVGPVLLCVVPEQVFSILVVNPNLFYVISFFRFYRFWPYSAADNAKSEMKGFFQVVYVIVEFSQLHKQPYIWRSMICLFTWSRSPNHTWFWKYLMVFRILSWSEICFPVINMMKGKPTILSS